MVMKVLLDTALAEAIRPAPRQLYLRANEAKLDIVVSLEALYGVERLPDGARAASRRPHRDDGDE